MTAPAWPEKMITQAEAFAKAAQWPVYADCERHPDGYADHGTIVLRCNQNTDGRPCGQSMGQLRREGVRYNGSLDEMLSMVLRHMVMAHDVPLNTRPRPAEGNTQ